MDGGEKWLDDIFQSKGSINVWLLSWFHHAQVLETIHAWKLKIICFNIPNHMLWLTDVMGASLKRFALEITNEKENVDRNLVEAIQTAAPVCKYHTYAFALILLD